MRTSVCFDQIIFLLNSFEYMFVACSLQKMSEVEKALTHLQQLLVQTNLFLTTCSPAHFNEFRSRMLSYYPCLASRFSPPRYVPPMLAPIPYSLPVIPYHTPPPPIPVAYQPIRHHHQQPHHHPYTQQQQRARR